MAVAPSFACVYEGARAIFEEPDCDKKADLSYKLHEEFHAGRLPIACSGAHHHVPLGESPPRPEPGQPNHVPAVLPGKSAGAKNMKTMIHALVHAEGYAMDTSTDIMARFGFNPELWGMGVGLTKQPARMGGGGGDSATGTGAAAAAADSAATPSTASAAASPVACCDCATPCPVPHLPRAFFLDWTRITMEEAKHFRKWRDRLHQLGARYGDYPGHDSMWQAAVETSHSLAARLAIVHMVHEARGLDTFVSTRARLARAGDATSCAIIDANHGEEIGHVKTARWWFLYLVKREMGLLAAAPPVPVPGASTTATAAAGGDGSSGSGSGGGGGAALAGGCSYPSAYETAGARVVDGVIYPPDAPTSAFGPASVVPPAEPAAASAADASTGGGGAATSAAAAGTVVAAAPTVVAALAFTGAPPACLRSDALGVGSGATADASGSASEEARAEAAAIHAYHDMVGLFHFTKTLKPPLNAAARSASGMSLPWYAPFLDAPTLAAQMAGPGTGATGDAGGDE